MKYAGMPMGMWVLFGGSFQKQLSSVYGYDPETAKTITDKAKPKYKELIGRLPEFEKADRFKMNIVNCAMLSSFLSAGKTDGGKDNGVLSRIHDDRSHEVVLPHERKEKVYGEGYSGNESHCSFESSRPESLFLEYGIPALPGRQRL